MRRKLLVAALVFAALPGCGEGFRSPARLDRVRALAVRTEPASGAPGRTMALELLAVAETEPPEVAEPRPLQVAWLAGCHNPPGRQYFACYPLLARMAAKLEPAVLQTPENSLPAGVFGAGRSFTFRLPDDILSAAPRVETDPYHYGVSYAFFGVCAGELRARRGVDDQVPFECVDPRSGAPVSAREFVTGFATIYSYEAAENQNPVLNGLALDGAPLAATACETDADCTAGVGDAPSFGCSRRAMCAPVISPCAPGRECPSHRIRPLVDASSAEPHAGATEIVWANFYSTAGRFRTPTQLVSDRQTGLTEDPSGVWRAPELPVGDVEFWVTLHDQRGGTAWTSFDVLVR